VGGSENDSWRGRRRRVVLEPSGHFRYSGVFHGASGGYIRKGGVPTRRQALTWCQVAGVGLKKCWLAVTGDATQAQIGIKEHLTDEIRAV
jgi:hypothetical protein